MPIAQYVCASCDRAGTAISMSECAICYEWFCNEAPGIDTCFENHLNDENDASDDGYGESPRVSNFGQIATTQYIDDPYTPHPLMRGKRAATVELEAEYTGVGDKAGQSMELPYIFGTTNDGSLSNGIEVTLPPTKGAVLVNHMNSVCAMMKDYGYGIKQTCGMHVHIDLRDKKDDKKFLSHLFNMFFAFEDILFAMQTQKRYRSEYTIPLRRQYGFYDMYGQQVDKFDFNFYRYEHSIYGQQQLESEKQHKYGAPRYAAFNFHSIYYRGSLEIRIHDGCLDAERALKWIDLLQYMIARVENGKAHSYRFMSKMVDMPVTEDKLRHFFRYLRLPSDLRSYVRERIEEGQGMGFNLGEFRWGQAMKGRASVITEPTLMYRNRRVRCDSCRYEFLLVDQHTCPACRDELVSYTGRLRYDLAPRRNRARSYATLAPEQTQDAVPNRNPWDYAFTLRDEDLDTISNLFSLSNNS